ncbi:hypothetical protein GCM10009861_21880 [Neomicrococcus aestuarii]|uniref:hypothetical protein n=1 Tax=Neomicrococcus aestuarii TaxID=556325 RepID=UPI0016148BB4|nr:hypothetical protein [Neomicrococcus aestuarii]
MPESSTQEGDASSISVRIVEWLTLDVPFNLRKTVARVKVWGSMPGLLGWNLVMGISVVALIAVIAVVAMVLRRNSR